MQTVRPYRASDRDSCLALFDGNTPRFFDLSERAGFAAWLDTSTHLYLVIERIVDGDARIVACGGHALDAGGAVASLCWGMVAQDLHGQGLGRALTQARLDAIRAVPGVASVSMNTSQHTQGFYARFGFETVKVTPDGFGPGIDQWDMHLSLKNVEPEHGHIAPVPLEKAYRLLKHGPSILVSARHAGIDNVMAAAWACALDFAPPKLTVVLDKATRTRALVESSGTFVIQVPTAAQLQLTHAVGTHSLDAQPDKLARAGVQLFHMEGFDLPFVAGCSAWLACRLIPEPHNQAAYDLFIGEVVGAWADTRVFRDGHWHFEEADPSWRSLHYIAGGRFYAIGEALDADT